MRERVVNILDLTYGEGRFYIMLPREKLYLVGLDIRKLEWIVEPDIFIQKPSWRWREAPEKQYHLIVADPPWMKWRRGGENRGFYSIYNMLGDSIQIIRDAFDAAKKYRSMILIHYKKPIKRLVNTDGFKLIKEIYFMGRWRKTRVKNHPYTSWYGLYTQNTMRRPTGTIKKKKNKK